MCSGIASYVSAVYGLANVVVQLQDGIAAAPVKVAKVNGSSASSSSSTTIIIQLHQHKGKNKAMY